MAFTLARVKVRDFAQWKEVFKEGAHIRQAHGSRGVTLFRGASDPNEVFFLVEWDNLEQGMACSASPELRDLQRRSGIISPPELLTSEERIQA